MGIAQKQSPSSSQVACSPCARKLQNLVDTYKLVSSAVNRDVNVKVSSDEGKRKVSEAVTPERASPVRKHSQQFSPGTKLLATNHEKIYLSSVKTNTLVKETLLTDSNPTKTPQSLSLELHEQSS